jgi:hypothetical protein
MYGAVILMFPPSAFCEEVLTLLFLLMKLPVAARSISPASPVPLLLAEIWAPSVRRISAALSLMSPPFPSPEETE